MVLFVRKTKMIKWFCSIRSVLCFYPDPSVLTYKTKILNPDIRKVTVIIITPLLKTKV